MRFAALLLACSLGTVVSKAFHAFGRAQGQSSQLADVATKAERSRKSCRQCQRLLASEKENYTNLKKRTAKLTAEIQQLQKEFVALKKENTKLKNQQPHPIHVVRPCKHKTSISLQKIETPYFCPKNVSDHDAWQKKQKHLKPRTSAGGDERGEWLNVSITPTYFCDKLQINLDPWKKPKLEPKDLVVALFTGDSLFYGRASANRDTWLQRLPHRYMFAATSEPRIPVIGLEKYKVKPDYDNNFNAQLTQLYAVKEMYLRSPNQKWYLILGDDNYVHIEQTLKILGNEDDKKALWISNQRMEDTIPKYIDLSKWPNYKGIGGSKETYVWASGATSWFTSNSATKAFATELDRFIKETNLWNRTLTSEICYCPDKISGLILTLLGYDIKFVQSDYLLSMIPHAADSMTSGKFAYDQKPLAIYHYVSPREMLAADQRVVHEKLDQMINANAMDDILTYFRSFIDDHFEVLRRRQVEVKYLAKKAGCAEGDTKVHSRWGNGKFNVYNDIPDVGPV